MSKKTNCIPPPLGSTYFTHVKIALFLLIFPIKLAEKNVEASRNLRFSRSFFPPPLVVKNQVFECKLYYYEATSHIYYNKYIFEQISLKSLLLCTEHTNISTEEYNNIFDACSAEMAMCDAVSVCACVCVSSLCLCQLHVLSLSFSIFLSLSLSLSPSLSLSVVVSL